MSEKPEEEAHTVSSDPPEFLEQLTPEQRKNVDNFDHTDVVWTGAAGELDPNELVAERGRDSRTLLFQVVLALVAGHQPDLSEAKTDAAVRRACAIIEGKAAEGRPKDDHGDLLLEVAARYHKALYDEGQWPSGEVPLAPILDSVVRKFGGPALKKRPKGFDSLIRSLERKFNDNRDLWLARATTDDCYYSPLRFANISTLKAGLRLLAQAGIALDEDQVRATVRPPAEWPADNTR